MGLFNEHSSTTKTDLSNIQGVPGPQGIGYKLDANGNFDIENKKLTNVKNGDMNKDVMTKSQIEGYVSNKTQYLDGVLPAKVTNNKAVIYSPSGGIHSNGLYLKDQYGQEVYFYNEDQDDNQIRLYIPNLKNNDSYGGRLKSTIVVTSIDQTIEGKKVFHDIEVPNPAIDGHASNKAYVDNEISKISDASDIYIKRTGDKMTGSLKVQKYEYPIQGDLNKVIGYESIREIFLSRKETQAMDTELDMNGHTIDNIKDPTNSDQAVNKKTLDNSLNKKANTSDLEKYFKKDEDLIMSNDINMNNNRIINIQDPSTPNEPVTLSLMTNMTTHFLDLKGSRKMTGNIQMDGHQVSGLTNFPKNDDHGANKKYVDDQISKANIKPTNIPKNVFKYIMESTNEWSVEYNLIINSFSDLNESPHSYNKKVLNITPKKTNFHYRFRFGIQVFPVDINTPYTLCVELLNRDYITWGRTQIFIEGLGIWLRNHNTVKYQHHYDTNGDIYYHRTIINFNRTSSIGPCQVFYTVHYDNRGGDLDTYPDRFKDQLYVLAYGCKGNFNNIDSLVYDKHEAYEIDQTKMKMLVDLDMDDNTITNVKTPLANSDAVNKKYHDVDILPFKNNFKIYDTSIRIEKDIDLDNNAIRNINNLNNSGGYNFIYGNVNQNKIFTTSNIQINFRKIHIEFIRLTTSSQTLGKSDVIEILISNNNLERFNFTYPSRSGYSQVLINRYFAKIVRIQVKNYNNISFMIGYKIFL